MNPETPTIPPETARHVLWHYGRPGGYQPGSFTQRLMEAIGTADIANVERLRTAYPELVAAMSLAKFDLGGIADLQQVAAGVRCSRCRGTDGPFTAEGLCEACARPVPLDGVA